MGEIQENPLLTRLRSKGNTVVSEQPKLDLDAYISNYKGRTRFARLLHIGTTSTYLSVEALKGAVREAKKSSDVARYENAIALLGEAAPGDPDAVPATTWTDHTRKTVQAETDRLEKELKQYKNNLIKESIRMAYQDLGKQYQSNGDLANSAKSYNKMYDYMTTNSHFVQMHMYLIGVAIDQKNWYSVTMNAQRIWASGSTKYEEARRQAAKLVSALGLAELASRNYSSAAEYFISTDPRMIHAKLDEENDEEAFNDVLTPNDIAVYGALCALATFDRSQLQARVLEHKDFRGYLELEPHLRRAITFFVASKYSACLSILETWRADYLLDPYLQPCFADILSKIRLKAIQQYVIPFSRVTFTALAQAFATKEGDMAAEITRMIRRGDLNAKIDMVDGVVLIRSVEKRNQIPEDALNSAREYERTAHLRLLRMGIIQAGLEVKVTKEKHAAGSGALLSEENVVNTGSIGDLISNIGGRSK